jgi:hypothetical protein
VMIPEAIFSVCAGFSSSAVNSADTSQMFGECKNFTKVCYRFLPAPSIFLNVSIWCASTNFIILVVARGRKLGYQRWTRLLCGSFIRNQYWKFYQGDLLVLDCFPASLTIVLGRLVVCGCALNL